MDRRGWSYLVALAAALLLAALFVRRTTQTHQAMVRVAAKNRLNALEEKRREALEEAAAIMRSINENEDSGRILDFRRVKFLSTEEEVERIELREQLGLPPLPPDKVLGQQSLQNCSQAKGSPSER